MMDLLAELVDAGTLEAVPGYNGHAAYRMKPTTEAAPKRAREPDDHWPEPDDWPDDDPWLA